MWLHSPGKSLGQEFSLWQCFKLYMSLCNRRSWVLVRWAFCACPRHLCLSRSFSLLPFFPPGGGQPDVGSGVPHPRLRLSERGVPVSPGSALTQTLGSPYPTWLPPPGQSLEALWDWAAESELPTFRSQGVGGGGVGDGGAGLGQEEPGECVCVRPCVYVSSHRTPPIHPL